MLFSALIVTCLFILYIMIFLKQSSFMTRICLSLTHLLSPSWYLSIKNNFLDSINVSTSYSSSSKKNVLLMIEFNQSKPIIVLIGYICFHVHTHSYYDYILSTTSCKYKNANSRENVITGSTVLSHPIALYEIL